MGADDLRRAVTRIAHEIVERNYGVADLVLIGLQTGGVPLAGKLAEALAGIDPDTAGPVGCLGVAVYRDDIGLRPALPDVLTYGPGDLTGKPVILIEAY